MVDLNNYLKGKSNQKLIYKLVTSVPNKRKDILAFIDNSKLAPSTLRKHYVILESYYDHLLIRREIKENLFRAYKKLLPKHAQVRPTKLIPFHLIKEIISEAPHPFNIALTLLFHLGLRRQELLKLTKKDFVFEANTWHVVLNRTKNKFTYKIELPLQILPEVLTYLDTVDSKLFKASVSTFYRFYKKHLKKWGIEAAPHSARATAATFLKSKGIGDRDVALSLHQAEQTVRLYDKRSKEQVSNQFLGLIDYE